MPAPSPAQAVVIGGGIVGCSVAYHLTKRGWRDVVLLERKQLTSGTTWHAAGLVTQLPATYNMSMLAKYSAELFPELERLTGLGTGFRRPGSILLATTAASGAGAGRGSGPATGSPTPPTGVGGSPPRPKWATGASSSTRVSRASSGATPASRA